MRVVYFLLLLPGNFVALASEELGLSFILLIEPCDLQMAVECKWSAHTNKFFSFLSSKQREKKSKREHILHMIKQAIVWTHS